MWATHDEAYVYLALKLDKPFDPKTQTLHIGSSVLEGGNRTMPELPGLKLDEGLETLITLGTDQDSEIRIASNMISTIGCMVRLAIGWWNRTRKSFKIIRDIQSVEIGCQPEDGAAGYENGASVPRCDGRQADPRDE